MEWGPDRGQVERNRESDVERVGRSDRPNQKWAEEERPTEERWREEEKKILAEEV